MPGNVTSRIHYKYVQIPPAVLLSGVQIWLLFSSSSSVLYCWLKFFIDILNLSTVVSVLSNNIKTLARPRAGGTHCLGEQEKFRRQRGSSERLKC